MTYDILESISQGEYGEDAPQDDRMEEVSNLLFRSSTKDETESDSRAAYRGNLYGEQALIEKYAEETGCWYTIDDVFAMGIPGPSGSENDTYVDRRGGIVYKTNNLIHTGSFYKLFRRLQIHNSLFPQTAYSLLGFTGYKGRTVYPLLKQRYIERACPALPSEIDAYMLALNFSKVSEWTYTNGKILISDLKPKNVLRDEEGDLYVIDAEIKQY